VISKPIKRVVRIKPYHFSVAKPRDSIAVTKITWQIKLSEEFSQIFYPRKLSRDFCTVKFFVVKDDFNVVDGFSFHFKLIMILMVLVNIGGLA
jgi:hypothetical protein